MFLCICINTDNSKSQSSLDKIASDTKKEVNSRPNQPWFNAKLRILKRKKHQTERKYKKGQNDFNYEKYRKQKSIYSNLKKTRINYYSEVLQFNESNSKIIYNTIKRFSGDMQQKIFPSGYIAKELVELCSKQFFKNSYSPVFDKF